MSLKKVPQTIIDAIQESGLTLDQLATRTGYSRETIRRWLAGNKTPSRRSMEALHRLVEKLRKPKDLTGTWVPHSYPLADEVPPPIPDQKCPHPPGSLEKIEMLRQRALRQEHLWSPADHGYDDEPMGLSY